MQTEMTIAQKIRASYEEQETSKLEELKALDKRVKRPATVVAYVYGALSSLVFGTGMCLAMKVIGKSLPFGMWIGIGVGLVGIALTVTAYPLYKAILKSRKKKYAKQIVELSDSLLNK